MDNQESPRPVAPNFDGQSTKPNLSRLLGAEAEAVRKRRVQYNIASGELCGLALSGGGIRSATFSLGLLQGLSALKLLQRIDLLSTVSGGGYTGSFLGGLFVGRGDKAPVVTALPEDDLLGQAGARKAIDYLRQSGRYLVPAGTRDYIYALALLLRNWLTLTLVMGATILLAELLLDYARFVLSGHLSHDAPKGLVVALRASPLFLLLPFALIGGIGAGWSYWLTMSDVSNRWIRPPLFGSILVCGSAACYAADGQLSYTTRAAVAVVAAISLVAILLWCAASLWERWILKAQEPHEQASLEDRIRTRLSNWQAAWASLLLILLFLTAADVATVLFAWKGEDFTLASPAVAATIPAVRWLIKQLSALSKDKPKGSDGKPAKAFVARYGTYLEGLAALVLVLAALAFWGGLAHLIAWTQKNWLQCEKPGLSCAYAIALVATGLFVVLAALTRSFPNLSSLATFYGARIRRAYLGAGNPDRIGLAQAPATPVRTSDPGDDLGLCEYYQRNTGAPVHLINITINETNGRGAATVQRDRHGLNMVISPAGISWTDEAGSDPVTKPLGHEDFTVPDSANPEDRPGQSLPLSTWIGISGAAFSTGLGSRTNLASSILAFLANVRLGYWWRSDRFTRRPTCTYANLVRELSASFSGTCKTEWYLSDGGHFENTAAYELVRREIPFIVVSDNGCDPDCGFEDIANLVRKCRIDFGAEIRFLTDGELDGLITSPELRQFLCEPAKFSAGGQNGHAIAMLAKITFASGSPGTLLVIKPRFSGDDPVDLARYKKDNQDFPQETTLDQFFNEAQWESYRKLGQIAATRLFSEFNPVKNGWQPNLMKPVDWQ